MENWIILLSFVALLTVAFVFKKLWLGVLAAIAIVIASKTISISTIDEVTIPIIQSFLISFELILLLFGAYLFYTLLSSNNHFESFTKTTATFSSKLSVIIILCLFMGSFMEGIAGFGIPAMLIAPLLLTLGFKPLTSIVLPLAANTTAVTFGALGTPFKIGLGISSLNTTVNYTVILNILPILTMPFILAFLYSKTDQIKVDFTKEWKMLLGAGFCFLIPYVATSQFSIEYPSVVTGVFGLLAFVSFYIPKTEKPPILFWWKTFYPYVIFVILLLVSKFFLVDYYWKINENLKSISLYQPGIIFILSSILYLLIAPNKNLVSRFLEQSKITFFRIGKPIITIVLLVGFSQLIQKDITVFANSYYNNLPNDFRFFITPISGVLGAFVTGSATMSNLLLNSSIRITEIAQNPLSFQLALLHTGSAIGNAISFQNIVMVKSVVNYPIAETKILRHTFFVVILYLLMVILSGLLILNK
jgi:lactate permease